MSGGRADTHAARVRRRVALALAALLAFAALWNVAPPPARVLLAFNVAVPEVGHWVALLALLAAALAAPDLRRRWSARFALLLALLAAGIGLRPLLQFQAVAADFEQRLQARFGPDGLATLPEAVRARLDEDVLDWRRLLLGAPPAPARVTRGAARLPVAGGEVRLDVYRPDFDGRFPAVVQVYGGSWQGGSPARHAAFARRLASLGLVVFAVDYRHAPAHPWPAQIEDMRRWLAWIREHGADWQADVSRLATFGRSAGSQLAMIAAWEEGAPDIAAVVGWYGPVDLEIGYREPPVPDPLDTRAISRALVGGPPEEFPQAYRDASPYSYADRAQPPTLLVYAGEDPVVRPVYGAALRDRLHEYGNAAALLVIPWASHAFDTLPDGPSAQIAQHYTARFLAWALYRAPADRPAAP